MSEGEILTANRRVLLRKPLPHSPRRVSLTSPPSPAAASASRSPRLPPPRPPAPHPLRSAAPPLAPPREMLRSLAAAALAAVAAADCWDENKVRRASEEAPPPSPRARRRRLRTASSAARARSAAAARAAGLAAPPACARWGRAGRAGRQPWSHRTPPSLAPGPPPAPRSASSTSTRFVRRRGLSRRRALGGPRRQALTTSSCLLLCPHPRSRARPQDGTNTILYSWDLRSLCNGGNGYTFTNGSTQYRFEICGSLDPKIPNLPAFVGDGTLQGQVPNSAQTNTYCNPEYNAYPNVGNFLQFFDPNPATSASCRPPSVLGRAAPQ